MAPATARGAVSEPNVSVIGRIRTRPITRGRSTSATPQVRAAGVLAMATVGIGAANYLMSLIAVRLLPAGQFSDFAAGQQLLIVLGTGSMSALPWAVARFLAGSEDPRRSGQAMGFGLLGAGVQALALAPVALVVGWVVAGPAFAAAVCVATLGISLLAGPIGYLQGREQIIEIAAARSYETALRIGAGIVLVALVSRSAAAALWGFPLGSAAAIGYALHRGRAGFPLQRMPASRVRTLTREAFVLGGIQVLLSALAALDSVYVDTGNFSDTELASYQAAGLFVRIPLYVSASISVAWFTKLVAAPDEARAGVLLRQSLRAYSAVAGPILLALLLVPARLVHLLVPAEYAQTLPMLRILGVGGVALGAINIISTGHQARGRFRGCLTILAAAAALQATALLIAARGGNLTLFAVLTSATALVTLAAVAWDGRLWLTRADHIETDNTSTDVVGRHRAVARRDRPLGRRASHRSQVQFGGDRT